MEAVTTTLIPPLMRQSVQPLLDVSRVRESSGSPAVAAEAKLDEVTRIVADGVFRLMQAASEPLRRDAMGGRRLRAAIDEAIEVAGDAVDILTALHGMAAERPREGPDNGLLAHLAELTNKARESHHHWRELLTKLDAGPPPGFWERARPAIEAHKANPNAAEDGEAILARLKAGGDI
jgi:hypothetical protein